MEKVYIIEHISDILDIPEDKFEDFLIDFKKCYDISKNLREITLILGDETDNKTFMPRMEWIDDGKHDSTVEVNLTAVESK